MKISTSRRSKANKGINKIIRLLAVAFWLAVWQIVSMAIGQEIILVSPASVLVRLSELCTTSGFWSAIWFTFMRITLGFFISVAAGTLLAALSAWLRPVRELLLPLMSAIKATPVASITILILIWVPSKNLSLFMALLMVLPIMYSNVLSGIEHTDYKLLEMAEVFRVPALRRIRFIYLPQSMPFFVTACRVSLGLCWKAGVAAEVIGMPRGSIGERLYQAKIYLETPDLFAWTAVIILISVVFEKLFVLCLNRAVQKIEQM